MSEENELALAAQMANVIARFEERCGRIERRQSELADRLSALVEARLDRWLQSCAGQMEATVRDGFDPSIAEFRHTVAAAGAEAAGTVRGLNTVAADLVRQRRRLSWVLGATLAACAVGLLTTSAFVHGSCRSRFDALRSQVTALGAVNRSDLVPRGSDRLSARVTPGAGD